MAKLFINTRDELTTVETDMVAVVQANGNYSHIVYINKREIDVTFGISRIEEMLKVHSSKHNRFIRLGRSIILNHAYLHKIDLSRQLIILSDNGKNEIRLNLSKNIIKPYKKAVVESIKIKNKNKK